MEESGGGEDGGDGDSSSSSNGDGNCGTLIIGAGIAGVAAAHLLNSSGVKTIVLEAGNRIGGRICTNKQEFGFSIDMGASWIHGDSPAMNPVAAVAEAAGLKTYRTALAGRPTYDHDLKGGFVLYRPGGGGAIDREDGHAFDAWFVELMEKMRSDPALRSENLTVAEAIRRAVEGQELSSDWRGMLAWFMCRIEGWFAADCDRIPASNWIEEVLHDGGHSVFVNGYSGVVETMSSGLDVRFGHRVASIDYNVTSSDSKSVEVVCENGRRFQAAAVIVTVPLGVLKSGSIEFKPELPKWKMAGMNRLGIGHQNKIALLFDDAFWPAEAEFLGCVGDKASRCSYFLALSKSHGKPALIYMPVGDLALSIETMSNDGARDFAMERLRQMIPGAPDPIAYIVSRWGSDLDFLGCYSLEGVHVDTAAQEHEEQCQEHEEQHIPKNIEDAHGILAEPLLDRLFFAGEATSSDFPGTVHGAYVSGLRAAQRVAQRICPA